jgi:hypothetical protein
MKLSSILGLNARSRLFLYKYNTRYGRKIANSKLLTAGVLRKAGIAHPRVIKKFKSPSDVMEFDWGSLPDKFALKPSRGLGGEGIIVVKKRVRVGVRVREKNRTVFGYLLKRLRLLRRILPRKAEDGWITTRREKVTADDLKLHTLDILEGAYSMGNVPDVAFIQEYVGRHKVFRRYAFRGTPDIRIIVFNKVPVMAMLRLPTRESGGRANLHQGAIGVGVDIATGITTKAIWHGKQIRLKPGTNIKLHGIKIPNWTEALEMAVKAQMATAMTYKVKKFGAKEPVIKHDSGINYVGVDIVISPDKGPQVLELNAQPGLQIQLANVAGLKKRLERVEDLDVIDAEHGVRIAKALFAERYLGRIASKDSIKKISVWEEIKIVNGRKKSMKLVAKIDTGAWRTSIDKDLARHLGLLTKSNILWNRKIRTSVGREERPVINLKYFLAGRKINTIASISKRSHLRVPVIIGRRDLAGFLVSPNYSDKPLTWVPPMWNKKI